MISNCFNKVTQAWTATDNPAALTPASDWVINPIFSPDKASCTQVGPNQWFYEADGKTIRPMTAAEIDADPNQISVAKTQRLDDVNALRDIKLTSGFTDSSGIKWNNAPQDIFQT